MSRTPSPPYRRRPAVAGLIALLTSLTVLLGAQPALADVAVTTAPGIKTTLRSAPTRTNNVGAISVGPRTGLSVQCQVWGENVSGISGRPGSSALWDRVSYGGRTMWVSDLMVDGTPYQRRDPNLPDCNAPAPVPSPSVVDDYPATWRNGHLDQYVDNWGYYSRECTSFVAWRLSSRQGFTMPWAIGNANAWGSQMQARGYAVNPTPARGAIAWSPAGDWGHVAWVNTVNSNGTVLIEEYNAYGNGTYNSRTVPASSFQYIHVKDF